MARKIDLVGLTKPKIQKRNTRLQVIMHIRDQKTQVTFMDKNIDLVINSKFNGSQQTHCKKELDQIDLRDHCIENQKRASKPSSY